MARKVTTRKSSRRKNLDPFTAMSLAQTTGFDKALLGKKGFASLSDKRTYTGRTRRNSEDIELLNDMAPVPSLGHIEFTPDGIERYSRDGYVYQAFSATPVFQDGYRMGTPEPVGYAVNPRRNPGGEILLDTADLAEAHNLLHALTSLGITPTLSQQYSRTVIEVSPEDARTFHEARRANPAKFDRCVRDVKRRGGAYNAYAVCTAAGTRNPSNIIYVKPKTPGKNAPGDKWTVGRVGFSTETRKSKRGALAWAERMKKPGDEIRVIENPSRRNPAEEADALYEQFHGAPPTETLEYREDLQVHGHLAGLGDLVHLVILMTAGQKEGQELQLNAPDPGTARQEDIVRLTSNEDKSQLYFIGGDESLDLKALGFRESFTISHDGESFDATDFKDLMEIGRISRVMYRTEKAFDDFETIDYHHLHGEDTNKYPLLLYDNLNARMMTAGGEYTVSPAGIVN